MSIKSWVFSCGRIYLILAVLMTGMNQLVFAAPQNREPIVKLRKSNKTCQQAITFVEKDWRRRGYFSPNRLSVGTVEIIKPETIRETNGVKDNYYDYPSGRTDSVIFVLTDSSKNPIDNFHSSPRLMTNLAAEVISACDRVGLVRLHYYEESTPIGYFPNGTVRIFTSPSSEGIGLGECGEFESYKRLINNQSSGEYLMRWGYQCVGG